MWVWEIFLTICWFFFLDWLHRQWKYKWALLLCRVFSKNNKLVKIYPFLSILFHVTINRIYNFKRNVWMHGGDISPRFWLWSFNVPMITSADVTVSQDTITHYTRRSYREREREKEFPQNMSTWNVTFPLVTDFSYYFFTLMRRVTWHIANF